MKNKKVVLICDDEEGVRESLKLILEDDYKLVFTKNGNEALSYLDKNEPDLVIMDIKMPVKNGLEAVKEIHQKRPDLKVIMITGYQSVEAARESSKYGIVEYITKPFDSEVVKKAVAKII